MAGFASNFTNLNSRLLCHLCVQVSFCPLNNPFIGLHRHAELLASDKRGWICKNGLEFGLARTGARIQNFVISCNHFITQMMHSSEWTLKYDEPEVENVTRMFCSVH